MLTKRLVLLMSLSVLLIGCDGTRYVGNTNYAIAGQHESATKMGVRYLLGRGVPQDNAKAFSYFLSAANEGDPFAENEVAYLYAAGKGTSQDYAKAFVYYQKAANHGLASAQYNLGLLYINGLGTAPDKVMAQQWLQKAAVHGFEPAKQALSHDFR
jgi:TPR repeat protein